jgi:hypothetical protein
VIPQIWFPGHLPRPFYADFAIPTGGARLRREFFHPRPTLPKWGQFSSAPQLACSRPFCFPFGIESATNSSVFSLRYQTASPRNCGNSTGTGAPIPVCTLLCGESTIRWKRFPQWRHPAATLTSNYSSTCGNYSVQTANSRLGSSSPARTLHPFHFTERDLEDSAKRTA